MAELASGTLLDGATSVNYRMLLPRGCADKQNGAVSRRAIICSPGHGGDSKIIVMAGSNPAGALGSGVPWLGDHPRVWADAGYVVASIDPGTTSFFDNDAIARMELLRARLVNVLGCKPRVGVSGISMGGGQSLAYLLLNPALTACVWAWMPAVDLRWVDGLATGGSYVPPYSTDNLTADPSWAAELAADYPSGFSGHDPMQNIPAYRNKVPVKVAQATDDNFLPYDGGRYFVSQVNDPLVTFRLPDNTGGHSVTFINKIPTSETLAFFAGQWVD